MRNILRTRAFLLLAASALLVLPGCGGGYGFLDVADTGSVEAENATDGFAFFPYTMMDFSVWPAGTFPSGGDLLPVPLDAGEAAYVGEFYPDYYDGDAAMESLFDGYIETWFDVPVDAGYTSTFAAY